MAMLNTNSSSQMFEMVILSAPVRQAKFNLKIYLSRSMSTLLINGSMCKLQENKWYAQSQH